MASGDGFKRQMPPDEEELLLLDTNKRVKVDDTVVRTEVSMEGGCTDSGLEHREPTPTEATQEVPWCSSLPATQSEGLTESSAKLWDSSNIEQRQIVCLSEQYRRLLKDKLIELTENVHFSALIPHLLQLDVLDKQTRDTIQLNATEAMQTLRLIDHLEKGPCWRLHGFLRALVVTEQKHIVAQLGLIPEEYEDVKATSHSTSRTTQQKPHFYKCFESDEKLEIPNDLLPGLLQHCGSYNRTLMKSSIFGHKDSIPIDLTQVWVSTKAECKQDQSRCMSIGKMEMFQKLFQRHPPHTLCLEGPAGAGKSTFMEEYAYKWSKDIISCEERGLDIPCEGHLWKLVLYIPLGSIRGTFTDTIQENLKCGRVLQQQMMVEIDRNGEGVLVIGDGIDELRDQTSKQSLCEYTKTCQEMVAKPKVLITARDGLLSIPRQHFDRELYIKGFSLEQGVTYIGKYFQAMYQITEHPVLDYTQTHQEELGWVLTNPLQVHILSELTASGFLTLEDMKSLTTIKLFRSLDHLMVTRDEDCRGVCTVSSNFYKACLRCLLNDERQITEEEVGSGCPYLSLLTKYTYRDQDYKERHRYSFPHEMVFEFFAMRGIIDYIKSTPGNKKALLLYLCSKLNMQNVLLLTYGFITQYKRELFPDTVVAFIRCWLLLQTDIEPCMKNELTQELPMLSAQIQKSFPRDILTHGLTTEDTTKMDRIFDLIQDMFTEPNDCLKTYGWAPTKAKHSFWRGISLFYRFILTSLGQCSPNDRAVVLGMTTERLLPCATHDSQAEYVVHHVAETIANYVVSVNGRFSVVQCRYTHREDTPRLFINIWCLQDLVPVLLSREQLHQLRQTDERYRKLQTTLNLTDKYEGIHLYINSTMKDLWGSVPPGGWSEVGWTPALTQLLQQYDMSYLRLYINHQAVWSELLSACSKVITCGHKLTQGLGIFHGKVPEEDLLQFLDWAHDVRLAVYVNFVTVVLAEGRDPGQWQDVDSTIRQKACRVRGEGSGKASYITYVSANGEVLCERYNP